MISLFKPVFFFFFAALLTVGARGSEITTEIIQEEQDPESDKAGLFLRHGQQGERELQTTLTLNEFATAFSLTEGTQVDFVWTSTVSTIYVILGCTSMTGSIEVYESETGIPNPATSTAATAFTSCGQVLNTGGLPVGVNIYFTLYAPSGASVSREQIVDGQTISRSGTATIAISDSASISTPAPTAAPTASCFSESATVLLEEGDPLAMKDLQIGQRVLVGAGDDDGQIQEPKYQTVYGFAHRDVDSVVDYLRITTTTIGKNTKKKSALEITSNHLIYLQGQKDPVAAGSLQVGDVLMHQSDQAEAMPATITSIKTVPRKGLYAPLTKDGTVVVDGLRASSYVSIRELVPKVIDTTTKYIMSEQTFFHWWMAPYRFVCTRINSELCTDNYSSQEEGGYIHWLVVGRKLAQFVEGSSSVIFFALVGLALACFCGFFMMLESFLERPIFWIGQIVCGYFVWSIFFAPQKQEDQQLKKKAA